MRLRLSLVLLALQRKLFLGVSPSLFDVIQEQVGVRLVFVFPLLGAERVDVLKVFSDFSGQLHARETLGPLLLRCEVNIVTCEANEVGQEAEDDDAGPVAVPETAQPVVLWEHRTLTVLNARRLFLFCAGVGCHLREGRRALGVILDRADFGKATRLSIA